MAGTNKALKAGTVVFKTGDHADGMYLVRKGELVVYFEQAGKEVVLAKIPEGGMVGEMAMFDRMPRSASVKASVDSEITHISLDDFGKLMKQIPKWFVGLMAALSSRLRTTNERLKSIETQQGVSSPASVSSQGKPFQSTLRMLHLMELLWHREGTKEGKEWNIHRKVIEEELTGIFGEPAEKVKTLLDILCSEHLLLSRVDSRKATILSMPNRASLRNFAGFMEGLQKAKPHLKILPQAVLDMMNSLTRLEAKAPYDQFTVTLEELCEEAKVAKVDASTWKDHMAELQGFGEFLKLTKTSSESGTGVRVIKGELGNLVKNLNVFRNLGQNGLD